MTATLILEELRSIGSEEKAKHLSRFFKTGPGDYGEGDRFLGVIVPHTRQIARANLDLPLSELQTLLNSPWHEARLCALLILVARYNRKTCSVVEKERLYQFYMVNTKHCNNWDLVDLSCRDIVGLHLLDKDRAPIYRLAGSENLWEQRISIVSTWAFIRVNDFEDTFRLVRQFMHHPHDLIHKAMGWMLREIGKRDRAALTAFLEVEAFNLPRTALRYSIEHYPEEERQYFLKKRRG